MAFYVRNEKVKPGRSRGLVNDTSSISTDRHMTDSSCFDPILREMVSDSDGLFRHPSLKAFFTSLGTQLVFSEKEFGWDTGGWRRNHEFDSNWLFSDTIYLNNLIFKKACREYLCAVVIHEVAHAYLLWTRLSLIHGRNGIDTEYLKQHFPRHWEWLTSKQFQSNEHDHILMSEDLVDLMVRTLYPYTNPDLDSVQRNFIAESLTWGSLNATPAWKRLSLDTCRMLSIDVWTRFLDVEEAAKVHNDRPTANVPNCPAVNFSQSLKLRALCN